MKRRSRPSTSTFVHAPFATSTDPEEAFATASQAQLDMLPTLIRRAAREVEGGEQTNEAILEHGAMVQNAKGDKLEFKWKDEVRFSIGIIAQVADVQPEGKN